MPVIAILILLAQNFGLGRVYPWNLIPFDGGRWLWMLLAVALLVVLAAEAGLVSLGRPWERITNTIERGMRHRAALIVLLAGNALFAIVSYNHYGGLGYRFPWLHLVVLGAAIPFVRTDRFWLSCGIGLALLGASIVHFPLVAARSDYLTGIQAALNGLALDGKTYAPGFAPAGATVRTMAYLPGVLLSHVPAWVLGIDLRWGQFVWRLVWMVGIALALTRHGPESIWRTVAHVFVLNPYFNFRHELYYEAFFAGIVAYQAWPRWRWISLPLLAWTRQWVWVMAPFLLMDWLAVQDPPWGRPPVGQRTGLDAGRQAAWMAIGAMGVSALFAAGLWPTTQWFGFASRVMGLTGPRDQFEYGLTLGPLAAMAGIDGIVRPLQATLVAAAVLLAAWRWWSARNLPPGQATQLFENLGLLTLCAFVLLNPFFEVYYWLDAPLWILAVHAYRVPPRRRSVRGRVPPLAAPR